MSIGNKYTQQDRLRSYSLVFSRNVFSDILNYGDYSKLNILIERYDKNKKKLTYYNYIKYLYKTIAKSYRCEYIYKNEIISNLLLKEYGTKNTIAINEFRVNKSIVDFALFNGESKAFEIKTEYDTTQRLEQQLNDYTKFFQKCYVVIPDKFLKSYENYLPSNIGIIILYTENRNIKFKEIRPAEKNKQLDRDILMKSIRASEYKNIVLQHYNKLPEVSCYELFDECKKLIKKIPDNDLYSLLLSEIKKRKNNTDILNKVLPEIRQISLCLNLNQKKLIYYMKN